MNEIIMCLTCYSQKLNFCWEIETKINASSVNGSSKDEIGTIFFKSDIDNSL